MVQPGGMPRAPGRDLGRGNKALVISLLHLGDELLELPELQQLQRSHCSNLAPPAPPIGGRLRQSLPRIPPGQRYEMYAVCYLLLDVYLVLR